MKPNHLPGPEGVGTARALLGLVEDHSAEDFQAAEVILSGQPDLAHVLRLLREFKLQSRTEHEPLSLGTFRDIVRRELISMPGSKAAVIAYVSPFAGAVPRAPPDAVIEDVVDWAVDLLVGREAPLKYHVRNLVDMLATAAADAGPEYRQKIKTLLRDLAVQAISENVVMLPTLHAISQLRARWAPSPLPYKPQELRQRLAARLFKDAERLAPAELEDITVDLLTEGLRGPADGAIAEMRRGNLKKAHGK